MKKTVVVLLSLGIILGLSWEKLFAQQETPTEERVEVENEVWVFGEVSSVDAQKGQLQIKYTDYETDEEKEMMVVVEPATTYENVTSLDQIKVGDMVGIDYKVEPEGRNLATNISVEKLEGTE